MNKCATCQFCKILNVETCEGECRWLKQFSPRPEWVQDTEIVNINDGEDCEAYDYKPPMPDPKPEFIVLKNSLGHRFFISNDDSDPHLLSDGQFVNKVLGYARSLNEAHLYFI